MVTPTAMPTVITVDDASGFTVGEHAELQQHNDWELMDPEGRWRTESWVPEDAVGQMFEEVAVSGNEVTVSPPVTLDYDPEQSPRLRPMRLVVGAGFQGLAFERTSRGDASTVQLKNTAGVWLRDCEGDTTMRAHLSTSSTLFCEIRDSYFHDSHDYGGGGHGYGASLGNHTTGCLIENNLFVHLRHAMMVQVGATGNVFGYNYSREPYQNQGGDWNPPDISLHGHYPSMNLFESNVVQEAAVADYWGPCGPGNTFFRNRLEAEGLWVRDSSHGQNIVGNELTDGSNVIDIDETVEDTFLHGNLVEGEVSWNPAIDERELPASLYLDGPPPFWTGAPWPALGADVASGGHTIPAEERYHAL